MNKAILIFLFLTISTAGFSQRVRMDSYNQSYDKYRTSLHFDYVHQDFDTTYLIWVADYTVEFDTVIPGMIGECYKNLKEKANKFGANAFRVKESDIFIPGQSKYISISVYWLRMENRNDNLRLHKSNQVYLFGFLGYHQEIEGYEVQIQEQEMVLHSLSYRVFTYPVKTDVELQLGSKIRGANTSFKMEERMFPKFFYFNMVKGSFKNAWIDEYSLSFGIFLTKILQKE